MTGCGYAKTPTSYYWYEIKNDENLISRQRTLRDITMKWNNFFIWTRELTYSKWNNIHCCRDHFDYILNTVRRPRLGDVLREDRGLRLRRLASFSFLFFFPFGNHHKLGTTAAAAFLSSSVTYTYTHIHTYIHLTYIITIMFIPVHLVVSR